MVKDKIVALTSGNWRTIMSETRFDPNIFEIFSLNGVQKRRYVNGRSYQFIQPNGTIDLRQFSVDFSDQMMTGMMQADEYQIGIVAKLPDCGKKSVLLIWDFCCD